MIPKLLTASTAAIILISMDLAIAVASPVQGNDTNESDWPSEEELKRAEQQDLELDGEPIKLDKITVYGEQFTFEQEVGLRLIRQALNTHKSLRREDRYAWVCRLRSPVGTRLKYLECARNGDLMALSPDPTYPIFEKDMPKDQQFGKIIWTSHRPVNEKKFEDMLSQLAGPSDFDKEFVAMALSGKRPPRNVPSEEELDRFAQAYESVERLSDLGATEDELISIIESQELTLSRYNEVVELVETYQSIENAVAERLAGEGRASSHVEP